MPYALEQLKFNLCEIGVTYLLLFISFNPSRFCSRCQIVITTVTNESVNGDWKRQISLVDSDQMKYVGAHLIRSLIIPRKTSTVILEDYLLFDVTN